VFQTKVHDTVKIVIRKSEVSMATTKEQAEAAEANVLNQMLETEEKNNATQKETPVEDVVEETIIEPEEVQEEGQESNEVVPEDEPEELEPEVEELEPEENVHKEGEETNEPVVHKEKKKLTSAEARYWKTKRIQEENARLKERMSYLEGKIEHLVPQSTTEQPLQPNIAPLSKDVDAQIQIIEKAFEDGQIDFNRKTALQAAVIVKGEFEPQINAQKKQNEVAERVEKAFVKNEAVLPGLRQTIASLKGTKLGNDTIIGNFVIDNADKCGMDVAYYLAKHPSYSAELMDLPVYEKIAKLVALGNTLTKPRQQVVKKTTKPSPQIRNSVGASNQRSSKDDDDYSNTFRSIIK